MKRFLPLLLIATGVLILGGAAFRITATGHPAGNLLPASLAGLSLTQSSEGPDAVTQIAALHGKDFGLVSGAVGEYDSGEATLWISLSASEEEAAELLEAMRGRIVIDGTPFAPLADRADGDRVVYVLEGMGQQHFYFQSGRRVIWLAVEPSLAEDALRDALNYYR